MIKIILNESQNPWSGFCPQLVSGLISSIIGFGGAFLLFWCNTKKEKERIRKAELKELNEFFEYLKFSIQRLIPSAIKQAESFRGLTLQLKEQQVVEFKIAIITAFNLKWIETIDRIKMQRAFFKNLKSLNEDKFYFYNQILTRLDLLSVIQQRFEKEFREYMSNNIQFENLYNAAKECPLALVDLISLKIENNQDLENYESEIIEVTKEWIEKPLIQRNEMYATQYGYVSKLEKLLQSNPQLLDLKKAYRDCTFAFKSYEKNKAAFSGQFEKYALSIEQSIMRLMVVLRIME